MNSSEIQAAPNPPSLMKSLMAGFDVVTRHLGLLLFSIGLDLLLWFGPQIRMDRIFVTILEPFNSIPELQQTGSIEMLGEVFGGINLMSFLRSLPVGIPSLIALRAPVDTPLVNSPINLEIVSPVAGLFLWIGLTIAGVAFGALYFSLASQAALFDRLDIRSALAQWPRHFLHIFLLSIFLVIAMFFFMLPLSCVMSFSLMLGIGAGQFPLWIALFSSAVIIWFIIPLFFSPHGIIASHRPVLESILHSFRISRTTFGKTTLFVFVVGVISQGMNILWSRPADDSWFLLVGVVGHAFVSAGLLSATFLYYKDAEIWLKHWTISRQTNLA